MFYGFVLFSVTLTLFQGHIEFWRAVTAFSWGMQADQVCALPLFATAVAGAGAAGELRERPQGAEQGSWEHPHGPTDLDHRRQAGGGPRQHHHGGEDHRQR